MRLINNIISVFKYEVLEIARSRVYLITLLILPFATLLFFSTMFYGGSIENLPIVLIDNDHSASSRQLVRMVNATRGVKVEYTSTSIIEAEELLRRGDAYAILLIPEGMERDIYSGNTSQVECYISGTNMSASGVIDSDIQNSIRTFSTGLELAKLTSTGTNTHTAAQEVMPINFLTHIISNPYINYGYYLAPIFMFVALALFTTLLTTYAIGRELYYATAQRWMSISSNSTLAAAIGKLLPTTVTMLIFAELNYFVIFKVMGMECAGSHAILTIGGTIFILAYQSIALFITTITSNMRLALSLGGGYTVMAFTFSGITFPTMAMFDAVRPLTNLFPLTWFTKLFVDQAMRGTPIEYSLKPLFSLTLFLVLPLFIGKRLRRITSDKQYWSND